ncbi:ABC transporter substrate-binding protein [Vibrio algarum]|uniref:Probable sugar-binding periplasmic protein n=1 Tax=Vibrio algarum TaxID=3020714 RepID=A0ABT4YQ36_9VIBR|nr:ABC transporter substrate-binding protein [Vibrio sp. KJ40-1]MDB1123149.1 ABC transporter substrate-binding protein [Vibrio sp. KJ40-1]
MVINRVVSFLSLMGAMFTISSAFATEIEVLHWWTSGGEARSAELLQQGIESRGHIWKDFSVAGGGGQSAMMVLKARAVSGNPPTSAQIKGFDIQEWTKLGFLTSLDDIAIEGNWDSLLPKTISDTMKYEGRYVAAPVNIHRVNWLWVNPKVMEKVGVSIPRTWDEFFIAADAIKAAGYIPLAHGRQPWQDATVFESIALAMLGADDYYKAFVALDLDVLSGEKMVQVFSAFKKVRGYIDGDALGRDWNVATQMVMNGEAAMQIMGDWVKGELTVAGKVSGEDYVCVPAPGTDGMFSYNVDSFVFFKSHDPSRGQGQKELAKTIMSKSFQEAFNYSKGSLPARTDVSMARFDDCAFQSKTAFTMAEGSKNLLPSLSADMSTTSYIRDAMIDVISEFFTDEAADPNKAPERLAKAVKAAL